MERLSLTDLAVFYFLPGFRASVKATSYTDTINAVNAAQGKRFKQMMNDTCPTKKKRFLNKLQKVVLQELGRKEGVMCKTKRETVHWNTRLLKEAYATPFEEFSEYDLPQLPVKLNKDANQLRITQYLKPVKSATNRTTIISETSSSSSSSSFSASLPPSPLPSVEYIYWDEESTHNFTPADLEKEKSSTVHPINVSSTPSMNTESPPENFSFFLNHLNNKSLV
ncbi:hypothetical protein QKQ25_gp018 [Hyphantria cunea granulovirus]|uniref:Uncharacterized protein n=1 Tax=Hyphantria cunea granulovirus TaxID=307448 RepID=A0AAF1D255_9BBAC|nr:hypothetical protein QKQ25_gp018 [Hyphantria cunea granulovirus]QBQ01571.1 hypothetical protein HycuGV_00018 [Hyphantria cunea granulovirus]